MENIKPFSNPAILNPEFPEIRFRVIVCPQNRADMNGAGSCNEDKGNSFYDGNETGLFLNQGTNNNNYMQTKQRHCREANLFLIFTNQSFKHKKIKRNEKF
jgi:hypothetical protein